MNIALTMRYALAAASHLAAQDDDRYHMVQDIAQACLIPSSFLAKVLQKMAHRGLLESRRGVSGGYRLGRTAESITLADVVASIGDPAGGPHPCLMRLSGCSRGAPCAVHAAVASCEATLWAALRGTSLASLRRKTKAGRRA